MTPEDRELFVALVVAVRRLADFCEYYETSEDVRDAWLKSQAAAPVEDDNVFYGYSE